ncbi:MAG: hypothetical protein HYS22_03635 [Deltaproteobacteria bacterium]|nr:hypothetical protein [Deltaproteobacteria bacterium]
MAPKERLRTVRFSPDEGRHVDEYLNKNRLFESFSSLARVATLSFIEQGEAVQLNPVRWQERKKPSFLWDYDLGETEVRELLGQPGLSDKKRWLVERILTQARFDEVFDYLTLDQINRALPSLRLPSKIRERWDYALKRWGRHE